MHYRVIISEAQRARIEQALKLLEATSPAELSNDDDIKYLLPCVEETAAIEAESPGVTHGWAL